MRFFLKKFYKIFLDAVFPSRCIVCGIFFTCDNERHSFGIEKTDLITLSFKNVMEGFLCSSCMQNYVEVKSPKCSVCGFMFRSREGKDHICGTCIKKPAKFEKARAYGLYDGALRKTIHCLKYYQKPYLAEPLGLLLFSEFIRNWDPKKVHVIIPVPLHNGRMKKRGFNQSFQLVRKWPEWSNKMGFDYIIDNIDPDILRRKKRTKSQVGMGKEERVKNMRGVFEVAYPLKIEGKKVLLIDDVLTTGATVNECAGLLAKKGAQSVDVLTLAHTERHLIGR